MFEVVCGWSAGFCCGRVANEAYLGDAAPIRTGDAGGEVGDAEFFAFFGQVVEFVGDVAAEGGDAGTVQIELGEVFFEVVEGHGAVGNVGVFVDLDEFAVFVVVEFVLNVVADDLFEDVIKEDDADCIAVFIDDEGEVDVFGEEEGEEGVEFHGVRHDFEFAADAHEVGVFLSYEFEEVFDVDPALDVVEVAVDEGEAGVARGADEVPVGFETVVDVEDVDAAARREDVLNGHVVEFEGVLRDFGLCFRDGLGAFAFVDQVSDFICAVGVGGSLRGVDAEGFAEDEVRGVVEEVDDEAEDFRKAPEPRCSGEGCGKGVANGQRFGYEFTEDDMREGEEAVCQEEGDALNERFAVATHFDEGWCDEAGDEGFAEEAEGEGGEGDAYLVGGEVGVEVPGDGAGIAFAAARAGRVGVLVDELAFSGAYRGEFVRHEEGVEQEEEDDACENEQDFSQAGIVIGCGPEGRKNTERIDVVVHDVRRGGKLGLKFFVDAGVALFEHGEARFLGVRDGKRFGYFRDVDAADDFADRMFAHEAFFQRFAVDGPAKFKALAAHGAGLLRVFGVFGYVFVDGHNKA